MRFGKLPFGRPVKICSTIKERVRPAKVEPSTKGTSSLSDTPRRRQKIMLSAIPNNPRHLFSENRNASTADRIHAVANAEINKVPI
jgi:hypothetical protein